MKFAQPDTFRLFDDVARFLSEPASSRPWAPAVDILENENELIVKADLPEVDMNNIDINIENGTLSLKGERKFEQETGSDGKSGYHRIERSYGQFARYFTLPETVEAEKVAANFKNGVLTITLPKKEVAKPRSVKINVN